MRRAKCVTQWLLACLVLICAHAWAQSADAITYVYTDPQGTPLAETDASGKITATFDYTPYGATALGSPPNGPGYTSHVNDSETSLVYMQARYYDPATARFLSVDPVKQNAGNASAFNQYEYASDNPIINVDPNGKQDEDENEADVEALRNMFNPKLGPNQALPETQYQKDIEQGECMAPGATPPEPLPSILPVTPLFRVVQPPELSDIQGSGTFRDPLSVGIKYFSRTPEGAASYAKQAFNAFGDGPFTTVQTSIPNSLIVPDMVPEHGVDGGIPTVVVPASLFSSLAPPVIVPYNAAPPPK